MELSEEHVVLGEYRTYPRIRGANFNHELQPGIRMLENWGTSELSHKPKEG